MEYKNKNNIIQIRDQKQNLIYFFNNNNNRKLVIQIILTTVITAITIAIAIATNKQQKIIEKN